LYSGHFVEQFQQHPMQARLVVLAPLYQFDQRWESALIVHHLESDLILPAVKEKKGDDEVQGIGAVLLFVTYQSDASLRQGTLRTCSKLYTICLRM